MARRNPKGPKQYAFAGKGTGHTSYSKLFAELVTTGVLSSQDGRCVFTENYAFKSPSAAAAVVNGRPANGTIAWKLQATGQTYKEWEAAYISGKRQPLSRTR